MFRRKKPSRPVKRLSRLTVLQLAAVSAIVLAPHLAFQPWTISLLCFVLVTWRSWLAWRDSKPPPRWLLLPIAGVGLVLTYFAFGNLLGKLPGLATLALFLPLKLLESNTERDARAALMLACFLLMGVFLHEQSMWVAVCAGIGLVGVIATLFRLQRPDISARASIRGALGLCGQGLPLMVLLFLLFPRIDGPLWGLPGDAYGGMTGLSERMSPGSISQLVESGEIAFRADFEGRVPPPHQRYWRGPVLSHFDGREWRPVWISAQEPASYEASGQAYDYTITMEPSNQRWLLALDFPVPSEVGRITRDFSLVSRQPVRTRQRYALRSHPDMRVGHEEDSLVLAAALQLPRQSNPRTQALGARWRAQGGSPESRVQQGIQFMRQAGLQYTLYPPLLGEHSADEFLFDSRRGFCEHFAAAFTILMRAADVPARVVTGYQGGEINSIDGTVVVRQSEAHAWTEVWLAGKGWVRIDPTAASFPRRIDNGIAGALPAGEALPLAVRSNIELLRNLRHRWEAVSNSWNQWILGYNARKQMEFLQNAGLSRPSWQTLTALLSLGGGLWMLWLAWRVWPRRAAVDALDRIWQRLCRKLARIGVPRADWEAPTDYAERIGVSHPELARRVAPLAERYARLRYGTRPAGKEDIAALERAVEELVTP